MSFPGIPFDSNPIARATTAKLVSRNGRLDALLVCIPLGIPLADVAKMLHVSLNDLRREPDAAAFQEPLSHIRRLHYLMTVGRVTNGIMEKMLRMPLSALGGKAPLQLMIDGFYPSLTVMVLDLLGEK